MAEQLSADEPRFVRLAFLRFLLWEPNQPPKFNKHWDSHLPHFRDLTALRQIRCSLRNTLVVHDCTKRYFLESLIWIHLEVSINASTPTIVGYVGL